MIVKQLISKYIKAKDPPWDAVLMGSVASTVNAKVVYSYHMCK